MNRRNIILEFIEDGSVGCEIGVWTAEFSKFILDNKNIKQFYLVDPWEFQEDFPESWYGGKLAKDQTDMDHIYKNVLETVGKLGNTAILRINSVDLTKHICENTLDWIYIDGNHKEEFVLSDLEVARKLVKDSGFIMGDDFHDSGIQNSVNSFILKHGLSLHKVESRQFIIRNFKLANCINEDSVF